MESIKFPGQKLFILIEKNKNYTYLVLYKKKYYEEASTVVNYLPAYFLQQYREGVLSIFALYYQDLACDAKWINE